MRNIPYYLVIYQYLLRQIYTGRIKVGDSLDSLETMCGKYGAGANTIHAVIRKLSEGGFITTSRGRPPLVISDCGNREEAVSQLCERASEICDTYTVICILMPSILAYASQKFDADDCAELRAILYRMVDHIENSRGYEEQKSLLIGKMMSKIKNSRIVDWCNNAMDSVMIPRMAPSIMAAAEQDMCRARVEFCRQLQAIPDYIEARKFKNVHRAVLQAYSHWKGYILSMIRTVVEAEGKTVDFESGSSSSHYLYDYIVSDIIDAIYQGHYHNGDSLPSLSAMCEQYQVCVPTVRKAYQILSDLRITQTVNGRGTLITLYKTLPSNLRSDAKGMAMLCGYYESLQMVVVTVADTASYAAKRLSKEQIREMISKLQNTWEQDPDHKVITCMILLGELIRSIHSNVLDELYMEVKKDLIWGIGLHKLWPTEMKHVNEKTHDLCLAALQALYNGHADTFAKIISQIFHSFYTISRKGLERIGGFRMKA